MTTETKPEPTILVRDIAQHASKCRACPQRILWAYTEKGHSIPLNDGFEIVESVRLAGYEWIRVRSADTHWSTCPASASFKRKAASK